MAQDGMIFKEAVLYFFLISVLFWFLKVRKLNDCGASMISRSWGTCHNLSFVHLRQGKKAPFAWEGCKEDGAFGRLPDFQEEIEIKKKQRKGTPKRVQMSIVKEFITIMAQKSDRLAAWIKREYGLGGIV